MAQVEISTSGGTKILVEGTTQEINAIVDYVKSRETTSHTGVVAEKSPHRKKNLTDLILDLKGEGFFDSPKKITEVKNALDQKAHFYPLPSVSTRLIRLVRGGELGRVKMESKWGYVKR
ncbi:hypothetical protein H0O02_02380 [Candidatus Micrarchaeota archaeon]|nr:hypothetical protein [Candidatus Micrarchaeota archaeon]